MLIKLLLNACNATHLVPLVLMLFLVNLALLMHFYIKTNVLVIAQINFIQTLLITNVKNVILAVLYALDKLLMIVQVVKQAFIYK